jgi:hypothetical protein
VQSDWDMVCMARGLSSAVEEVLDSADTPKDSDNVYAFFVSI